MKKFLHACLYLRSIIKLSSMKLHRFSLIIKLAEFVIIVWPVTNCYKWPRIAFMDTFNFHSLDRLRRSAMILRCMQIKCILNRSCVLLWMCSYDNSINVVCSEYKELYILRYTIPWCVLSGSDSCGVILRLSRSLVLSKALCQAEGLKL